MRILIVHNRYLKPGGEDSAVDSETVMLEQKGHTLERWITSNETIVGRGLLGKVEAATSATWSQSSFARAHAIIRSFRPDVIHCHNTFPFPGPSVYYAARMAGVPTVQTLHNYRLLCLNGLLFRDGAICHDCVGKGPISGIRHACYRGSAIGSAATAMMLWIHRGLRTWSEVVSSYIALSAFSRAQFVLGGVPGGRIAIKPNVVSPDPGEGRHTGGYALFAGRLVEGKGVQALLGAWELMQGSPPLRIAGDGPLRPLVEEISRKVPGVSVEGHCSREKIIALMKDAALLIVPSVWEENCPMSLLEGLATGLPAIVSAHGSLSEIMEDTEAGWMFFPGAPGDLAAKVRAAMGDSAARSAKSRAARAAFLRRYSQESNYDALMAVYERAIHERFA